MIESDNPLTLAMPTERETVFSRVFNAPRQLVFEAMTRPEHVQKWYGLRSHTMSLCEIDFRPGGAWRYVVQAADGSEHGFSGVYQEIEAPTRLVYSEGYEAMPGHDYLVTVYLSEEGGKTTVTGRLQYRSQQDRDGHYQSGMEWGMRESMARLDELLDTLPRTLVIERIFNAPRELVWRAWTEPEHLMRWHGPKGYTAPISKIDFRVGGTYHSCMRSPEGQDYWSTGTYQEIVPLERIVCSDSFADPEGNVVPASYYGMGEFPLALTVTVTFEDLGGKTKMTLYHAGFPAGDVSMYATAGWNESFDKLADTLG